jgi:hypothetical protein
LDFVHEVQDALDDDPEFDLTGVCEADEIYVVAGEKGLDYDEPCDRGLKKRRGTFESDKPSVVTLVRRSDGRAQFGSLFVRIPQTETRTSVNAAILCTDQDSIYGGINEYDEIDGHLAINHDDHYVVCDAHTNNCENRHSFLRNWLRRFRGVSKHHLQDYLNFFSLTLNTDRWFEEMLSAYFYT